ncbi:MAG TPA: sortase [Patescibacteria group bacterium]
MLGKRIKKFKFKKLMSKRFIDIAFVGIISIYLGFAFFRLSNPIFWERKEAKIGGSIMSTPTTKFPPTEIKISNIKIDLPISAGLVDGNTWDLYDDKIAWLATSAVPGEGNVILYGHDRRGLFGDLYKLKVGDVVEVKKGNDWFKYRVSEVHRVLPTDVASILSDKNRLTMYTCDGTFDQKRLVVYADPVD